MCVKVSNQGQMLRSDRYKSDQNIFTIYMAAISVLPSVNQATNWCIVCVKVSSEGHM